MADWHIGQKVVCIAKGWQEGQFTTFDRYPMLNIVYTIRDIILENDNVFFLLEEIINPHHKFCNGFIERRFISNGFRPVKEFKNDISVFTELLNKLPASVEDLENV